jgi:hypothetical protein
MKKIESICGGQIDASEQMQKSFGSKGAVVINYTDENGKQTTLFIGCKPKSIQGYGSAGINNEKSCIATIEAILQKSNPIDIAFVSKHNRKQFICRQIVSVTHEGRNATGGRKSDVCLHSANGSVYNISLKKPNADKWESLDTKAKGGVGEYSELQKIVDKIGNVSVDSNGSIVSPSSNKGKQILIQDPIKGTAKFVAPFSSGITWKANAKIAQDVVFGTDCDKKHNGCVIQNDFEVKKNRAFFLNHRSTKNYPDGVAFVYVDNIIDELKDVVNTKAEPYLFVSNSSGRTSFQNYTGIRAQAVQQKRISGSKQKILNLNKAGLV